MSNRGKEEQEERTRNPSSYLNVLTEENKRHEGRKELIFEHSVKRKK